MTLKIRSLIGDAKCYEMVRDLRWPDGLRCPHCDSARVTKQGHDDAQPHRPRYECQSCRRRFDDLTGTIFAPDTCAPGGSSAAMRLRTSAGSAPRASRRSTRFSVP